MREGREHVEDEDSTLKYLLRGGLSVPIYGPIKSPGTDRLQEDLQSRTR